MLTINVVRCGRAYVGQSFSDRWNLRTLEADFELWLKPGSFNEFRRQIRALGFRIVSLSSEIPVLERATDEEVAAMGGYDVYDGEYSRRIA